MWFVGENPSQICGRNFWPCKLVSITLFDEFWHQASLFCDVLPSQPCAWPHIQFSSSFLSHSSTPWASGSDKICQDIFESGQSCSLSWNHPTRLAYLCGMRVAPKLLTRKDWRNASPFFVVSEAASFLCSEKGHTFYIWLFDLSHPNLEAENRVKLWGIPFLRLLFFMKTVGDFAPGPSTHHSVPRPSKPLASTNMPAVLGDCIPPLLLHLNSRWSRFRAV